MTEIIIEAQYIGQWTSGRIVGDLIRCKDCKHWSGDDDETYCEELGILNTHYNSYCSWAEKKVCKK